MTRLLDTLKSKNLQDVVNIMIFGDHGMIDVSPDRTIDVTAILDTDDVITALDSGSVCNVWPKPDKIDKVKRRSIDYI